MERLTEKELNMLIDLNKTNTNPYDRAIYLAAKEAEHYRKLKEQGQMIILPCKVGDTVYEVQEIRHRIQPLEIISVYIGRMGELYFNWELKDGIGIYKNVKGFGISQLGKTVFLTQNEAKAALKEMENDERRSNKKPQEDVDMDCG